MKVSKRPKIRNIQKKSSIAMCRGLLRASDKRSESASFSDSSDYASSFGSSRGSSSIGSYSDASCIESDSSSQKYGLTRPTDAYLEEQGDTNITIDSLDMCYDREQDDHDDTDKLAQERDLLASLIEKLKCEINDSKNHNKFLESSNKALVDKFKGEIEDFRTKNKSLES
ncbi:hypothetical protein Tco_1231868, partial [Tanacetum coccineum]